MKLSGYVRLILKFVGNEGFGDWGSCSAHFTIAAYRLVHYSTCILAAVKRSLTARIHEYSMYAMISQCVVVSNA